MKIYTKKGDTGSTSLLGGTKVAKDDLRVQAYGALDEVNSWMGLLRDLSSDRNEQVVLLHVQNCLFIASSHLASDVEKSSFKLPELVEDDVYMLEKEIDRMDNELSPLTQFILPGGHTSVSYCHIARTVCRRAEREITALLPTNASPLLLIVKYVNRLSDYLFTLSRYWSKRFEVKEIPWTGR